MDNRTQQHVDLERVTEFFSRRAAELKGVNKTPKSNYDKTESKVVPVHAMKACRRIEVQLH
jgi:hypothetical protein